jgi:chemotaxis protein MotB
MPKQAWIVAGILTTLLLLGVGGLGYWHRGLELRQAQADLAAARAAGEANRSQLADSQRALQGARARIEDLQRENTEVTRNQKSLEDEMRRSLESRDITISELQGKLTVNILDRILFDSGEATLKPEGEDVLRKVAAVLAQYPTRQVHVIGHTDNVPIRASARGKYPSNWELSTARATAAVRFLSEQAGVGASRLGAVGYGEYHPVADNETAEGRAQNRRIALVVLSEELVGSDATPASIAPRQPIPLLPAPANAATNSLEATNAAPGNPAR